MPSRQIILSNDLEAFAETQVITGVHSSFDDYVAALIQRDRRAKAELEALLLQGVASGGAREATPAYWDQKRAKFLELHLTKAAE